MESWENGTSRMTSVKPFNLGLHFFASKVALSCPSVDRFGNVFCGLMTLGQVKSVPNFCEFGPQTAEKQNI